MGVVYSQALSQSGVHQPISHSGHGTLTQPGHEAGRCPSGRVTAGSTLSRGRGGGGGTLVSGGGGGNGGGSGGGGGGVSVPSPGKRHAGKRMEDQISDPVVNLTVSVIREREKSLTNKAK